MSSQLLKLDETHEATSAVRTPEEMREQGALDHDLNRLAWLITCARRIRRAQEAGDLAALREYRFEIRMRLERTYVSDDEHPNDHAMSIFLAQHLEWRDRATRRWYNNQRRTKRRAQARQLEAA